MKNIAMSSPYASYYYSARYHPNDVSGQKECIIEKRMDMGEEKNVLSSHYSNRSG